MGLLQCSVVYMLLYAKQKTNNQQKKPHNKKPRKSTRPMLECEQFSPITQEQPPQELVMCNAPVIKPWEYVKNQGME